MKFLTISKVTDTAALCPANIARPLMEATISWLDAQKKAGKILEFYAISDGRFVVICEERSADDAVKTLASNPFSSFLNDEMYALADGSAAMKVHLERIKQAEKLSLSAPK